MKKKSFITLLLSIRHFAMVVFMTVAVSVMSASAIHSKYECLIPDVSNARFKQVERTGAFSNMKKTESSSPEDNKPKVTIRVEFPPIGEEWSLEGSELCLYNETGYFESVYVSNYDEDGNEIFPDHAYVELTPGTYDFFGGFDKINPACFGGIEKQVLNILENVEIYDGAVVKFNPEDCTVCLRMETFNPDGEKTRFSKMRFYEDWSSETLEEGNVSGTYLGWHNVMYNGMTIKYTQQMLSALMFDGSLGEFDVQNHLNFYVNPVSDKYVFRNIGVYGAWPDGSKGVYVMVNECRGAEEGVYTNSRTFVYDDACIVPTPSFENIPEISIGSGIDLPYCLEVKCYNYYEDDKGSLDKNNSVNITSLNNEVWKVYSAGPEHPVDSEALYFAYSKQLNDAYMDLAGTMLAFGTYGSYVFPLGKEGLTTTVSPYGVLADNPDGETYPWISFPGNISYVSLNSAVDLLPGESVPMFNYIRTLYRPFIDREELLNDFECWYSGRLNETIGSDLAYSDMKLLVDDNMVADGYNEMHAWMQENSNVGRTFRIESSTSNFEVDGIQGGNECIVGYVNVGDDTVPPSATMLQLRSDDNVVSQVFDECREARIFLSAADFSIEKGKNQYGGMDVWMVPSVPAKVTATVKPTGVETEAFEEIALTENAEAFDPRGFGALYTGSLAGISMTSPTGWFDLTIAVEDAAGNSQVQTLSPCFKINALASVGELGTEDHTVRVSGRDIIAPQGSRVYTVSGLPSGTTGLTTGLYLVVTPSGTRKVAIR